MTINNLNSAPDYVFSYAPGKIILTGEHAVVYGARALAVPIDIGVRVAVSLLADESKKCRGPLIRGIGPFLMRDAYFGDDNFGPESLKSAISYLIEVFGKEIKGLSIVVDGSLPCGMGLGSSAALSIALIKGISQYLMADISSDSLLHHAFNLEKLFHGRPSGIDHNVIAKNQGIGFEKQGAQTKNWPIHIAKDLNFVIGISGPHDGTKNAVDALARRRMRQKNLFDRTFSCLNEVSIEAEHALCKGEYARLGEMLNMAQGFLNALSLSTPEIEKLCFIARKNGALGAKLTGAGGGGAVIALVDEGRMQVFNAFKAAGYQAFLCSVLKNTDKG